MVKVPIAFIAPVLCSYCLPGKDGACQNSFDHVSGPPNSLNASPPRGSPSPQDLNQSSDLSTSTSVEKVSNATSACLSAQNGRFCTFAKAVLSFPPNAAPGPSGLCANHLNEG
uniref:Uncharacterized protein n=1 Tax=Amphimedon queenslandica TaxID=400682 RepID=A0A1X7TXR2_AMPQE